MRKALFVMLLMLGIFVASAAQAAEEFVVYPCMPWCCEFDCVMLDTDCDCCCPAHEPLTVEFIGMEDEVLGTAVFDKWCDPCDPYTAKLDKKVMSNDVCRIRFIKADEDCACFWLSLKVLCEDPCNCCGKWKMAWKGDTWCWSPVK